MKLITSDFLIKAEPAHQAVAVEHLYDQVFGPARFTAFVKASMPCGI